MRSKKDTSSVVGVLVISKKIRANITSYQVPCFKASTGSELFSWSLLEEEEVEVLAAAAAASSCESPSPHTLYVGKTESQQRDKG